MRAMVFEKPGHPLRLRDLPRPTPGPGQILIRVEACGVCRTDLHIVDGELTDPKLPLVPGHEVVGRIAALGPGVDGLREGQRVGVPWLGHACGCCPYCEMERENLCDEPLFTGYTFDGGYAEYCLAHTDFTFPLPEHADPVALAPLLCAGLIGYRCLSMAGNAQVLGLYGFGAAAHILCQIAVHQGRRVLAFTRDGDITAQDFALRQGAVWAGGASEAAPELLDAALIFAPVGALVPTALKAVRKGGRVICGGIHMSDIPGFPYADLWEEREIRSVANLTRRDGEEFFPLAEAAQVQTTTVRYPLDQANAALDDLRSGRLSGAAVLVP
ncbi:zinc-dependent alcohol dehydrogenase family protein [Pseudodonghicola flavimaris]|uniref:alcohol dehydrogenase n=1 Tax=Pseudodonghicola flavimaris TaxID=3050036 RepID=A0ABT7EXE2_9RHOB|nr:zinc-dependent alcohol dehydrogenase family protein [Pseudodonghicola flavimaris]MDK3017012.1 zinc-dependent alcohol dehydrogenase family protein [Pseudodonghicola flavimaris]